jgi:hypothetical protein
MHADFSPAPNSFSAGPGILDVDHWLKNTGGDEFAFPGCPENRPKHFLKSLFIRVYLRFKK